MNHRLFQLYLFASICIFQLGYGQRVPARAPIKVPTKAYPDIASSLELIDVVSGSIEIKRDIKLTTFFKELTQTIKRDLSLAGACKDVVVHMVYDGYNVVSVYVESTPIVKTFVLNGASVSYSPFSNMSFITKPGEVLFSGTLRVGPTLSCAIAKNNLPKYSGICNQSFLKFKQIEQLLWDATFMGNNTSDSLFEKSKRLQALNDSLNDLEKENELCNNKQDLVKEKLKQNIVNKNKVAASIKQNQEALITTGEIINKYAGSIKNLRSKYSKESAYWRDVISNNPCNCPEQHETTSHHNIYGGYSCENWKGPIPCADDFICQRNKKLGEIKTKIESYSKKKDALRLRIDKINERIAALGERQQKLEENRKKYKVNLENLDCNETEGKIQDLRNERVAHILNTSQTLKQYTSLASTFAFKKYLFHQLFSIEQQVYLSYAENNFEAGKKYRQEYLSMLGSLRKSIENHVVFAQVKFPDPLVNWKNFKSQ